MAIRFAFILIILARPAIAQSVVIGTGSQETIGAGSQVVIAPGNLDVQTGASLMLAGTSSTSRGTLTSGVATGVLVNVLSGGTLDSKFGKLESILRVVAASGAKVTRIHDTVFTDLPGLTPGATAWIDLSALIAGDRANLPFSFNRVTFQDPQTIPTRLNIKAGAGTPLVRCLGNPVSHGNRWGNAFDEDTANVVLWNTGQVTRTSPTGAFDTVEDALKDGATTASSIVTVSLGALAFIDDIADFDTVPLPGASQTGPILRNACLAPMSGKAVCDSDPGSAYRGRITNCYVARGSVEETSADNCTFFDPSTTAITVKDVSGINCLIESGAIVSGTMLTTSLLTATPAFFVNAGGYDFHMVSPGANAAIDEGTLVTLPQTPLVDADGESRGADGKVGGTGSWDIGADEFILLSTPVITTVNNKKTNDNTPIITGTGSPNVTVTVYFSGTSDGTATSNGSGAWTYHNLVATKADNSYAITAIASGSGVSSFPSSAINLVVDTVCNPPTNVTATPKNAIIDIEWTPSPDPDVLGYRVFRSTTGMGGAYSLRSPSGQLVTGTRFRDSGLTNGSSYSYKVTAVDNAANEKH